LFTSRVGACCPDISARTARVPARSAKSHFAKNLARLRRVRRAQIQVHHLPAGLRRTPRHGAADAAGAAGDQHGFAHR
jgi:hypothetical protein